MINDFYLFQAINQLAGQWPWLNWLGIFLAKYLIWLILAGIIFYFLFFIKLEWWKKIKCFLILILSVGLAYFINWLISLIYFRPRPFVSHPEIFKLIEKVASDKSFPSDHAALSFVLAFTIFLYNKTLGIIFLVLAALVGISRIFVGVHYPLDIIAGVLVGWFSVWFVRKIII